MAKKDNEEIPFSAAPGAGNSEKLKALQAAMDKIEKTFGKGSIMKMGDDNVQEVEVIPTGSVKVDFAFCLDRFILASEAGVILRCNTELSFIFP